MNQAPASLRDAFGVSSPALDPVVAVSRSLPGCHGARPTGAGFAGAAVALVAADRAEGFKSEARMQFGTTSGLDPAISICRPAPGATVQVIGS